MGTPYLAEIRVISFNYAPRAGPSVTGRPLRSIKIKRCFRCWEPPTVEMGKRLFSCRTSREAPQSMQGMDLLKGRLAARRATL